MAINKISGNILADNLQRGANLAIQGNLVYFDVDNNRVGILTSSPSDALEVAGNLVVGNVTINLIGNIDAGNVYINNLSAPVANSDAATKIYVDNVAANANIGNFTFSNTTISTSVTPGNITLTPTGNSLVFIDTVSGLALPAGDETDRPLNPPAGTIRFNNDTNYAEVYDGIGWDELVPGGTTTILNQTINPDGITSVYTLDQTSTAASILVTINGVQQTPDIDYTVSGTDITFTTTPIITDTIQIRFLAGVSSTDYITNANGNAIVRADSTGNVVLQAGPNQQINVTGNIIPAANVTYSLGTSTERWANLWLSGTTIALGNVLIKNIQGNTIGFYGPNGTTPATIDSTNIDTTSIGNGTSNVTVVSSGGNIQSTVNGNSVLVLTSTGANVNGYASVSGNISGGNISVSTGTVSLGNITNNNANGVGNIGDSTTYFDTVFAKSTSAQYADLAELFTSDQDYDPGTVLIFGGDRQVTACNNYADSRAAGIVSTNPAHLMNSGLSGTCISLALSGQVPCQVIGPIHKGDVLVTSDSEGHACKLDPKDWQPGVIVGKALENCGPGPHKILVLAIS